MRRYWWVPFAAISAFFIGFFYGAADAHADEGVTAVDDVPARVVSRISTQLRAGDDIQVFMLVAAHEYARQDYYEQQPDKIVFVVIGNDVYARGNDWVPQVYLDDVTDRVNAVARTGPDRVIGMIAKVHDYQASHAKPAPPPPPPPPPAPPSPPFDWSPYMLYIYIGVPILILFLLWLPLEIRRRRRVGAIARRADEQADWGFDKYGIKTGNDL